MKIIDESKILHQITTTELDIRIYIILSHLYEWINNYALENLMGGTLLGLCPGPFSFWGLDLIIIQVSVGHSSASGIRAQIIKPSPNSTIFYLIMAPIK